LLESIIENRINSKQIEISMTSSPNNPAQQPLQFSNRTKEILLVLEDFFEETTLLKFKTEKEQESDINQSESERELIAISGG